MELILCQDIKKLGKIGDVVKVKDGYARNFLIPQKVAYVATPANLKRIEMQKAKTAEIEKQAKDAAEKLADKLNKVSCTVTVEVNDLDKLYGSVTEADIIQALEQEGHSIDANDIVLEKSIDELGIFDVGIRLHRDVVAKVRLWVTKK